MKAYRDKHKYGTKQFSQAVYKTHRQVQDMSKWWYGDGRLSSNLEEYIETELGKDWLKADLAKVTFEKLPG